MPRKSGETPGETKKHLKIMRKQSRTMLKVISKKVKKQMIQIKTRRKRKKTKTMKKSSRIRKSNKN